MGVSEMPGQQKKGPSRRNAPPRPDREGDTPVFDDLVRIFEQCNLILPAETLQRIWAFHQLLRDRNRALDLTRIRGFESMVVRHYVDCAVIPSLLKLPEPLLDIGTGAGFPGVILKILKPDLQIILAESRGKKLAFLDEACRVLELDLVDLFPHKVTPRSDLAVRGVITRDLEPVRDTLEKAAGFLPRSGRVICMKGPKVDEEKAEALSTFGPDFQLIDDIDYELGRTGYKRRLLVFERTGGQGFSAGRGGLRVKEIASAKNPSFQTWKKLSDGRGIRKHGLALMSGLKQVRETLKDYPAVCRGLIGRGKDDPQVDAPPDLPRYRLRPEIFRDLDAFGAGPPLLLVEVPIMPKLDPGNLPDGCLLTVPFQDPANVGAVIRSAAAFGVPVVLLAEAGHPFHPRSLRAAGPAVFRTPLYQGPSIRDLAGLKHPIVALGASGTPIRDIQFPKAFFLAPGVEGPGLPDNLTGALVAAIPMAAGVESLNAAAAAAIAMYEWRHAGDRG